MMLGPEKLKKFIGLGRTDGNHGIVVVPDPFAMGLDIAGSASIDLRLGRWFLALQQSRTSAIELGKDRAGDEFEAKEGKIYYVPFNKEFVIHPGRFVLGTTLEWIRVPRELGGFITGKSSIGRRGLVIETAAGLHPHFSGCITLELSNVGEVPISIVPGMRICQVFFHQLEGHEPEDKQKTSFGGRRRPTFGSYKMDDFVRKARAPNLTLLPGG